MRTFIALFKFFLFALVTLITLPLQLTVLAFTKGKTAYAIPFLWEKAVRRIFCIKLTVVGTPSLKQQTIFVSNHISYLDIPTLGSVLPVSFVAKKDVASWPVFGFLSKLQQTAFISRERSDAQKEKYALDTMLKEGKSLIIFPEGTSTDGRNVRDFKSSLFSIAFKDDLPNLIVQPLTISMVTTNGNVITTQDDRDLYSWHIDMDTSLATHLWRFAKSSGAEIKVIFHPPIAAHEHKDRKTLAKTCHFTVSNGLEKFTNNNQKENAQ